MNFADPALDYRVSPLYIMSHKNEIKSPVLFNRNRKIKECFADGIGQKAYGIIFIFAEDTENPEVNRVFVMREKQAEDIFIEPVFIDRDMGSKIFLLHLWLVMVHVIDGTRTHIDKLPPGIPVLQNIKDHPGIRHQYAVRFRGIAVARFTG